MFHTRHFVLKICEAIQTGIRSNYSNTRILFGVQKTWIPNTEYYSVLGKSKYRIQILLFGPTISIVFKYQISCLVVTPWTSSYTLLKKKCDTWHLTHDTWYVTHDMWHVIHSDGCTFSPNFSSQVLRVWDRQCTAVA